MPHGISVYCFPTFVPLRLRDAREAGIACGEELALLADLHVLWVAMRNPPLPVATREAERASRGLEVVVGVWRQLVVLVQVATFGAVPAVALLELRAYLACLVLVGAVGAVNDPP